MVLFGDGLNMLHPHLRLPVETGLRCLLFCALLALVQPINRSNIIIEVISNTLRIPGFEAIFLIIYISLILRFFHIFSLEIQTNNPSACSENNPAVDASPKIYANLALIIV